ncbi:DUF726 domain-containing protein [Aliarcobacter butzleri]|uniref:DUF726 domain-containing protein n=1 Tax=Aliarcobacter butzleri TaxID=28197 RepID=UPI00191813A9|nr:DUF726 domain-containing protein [Aliarcobacter butzleri]
MINAILGLLGKEDAVKIFNTLIYSINQDKTLEKEEVEYISRLVNVYALSNEQINQIFLIDTRLEINFEELKENFTICNWKVFLFLSFFTGELFQNNKLRNFIKTKILKSISSIDNEIMKLTQDYISLSKNLYDAVYNTKNKGLFARNEKNIKNYEKLFIIDEEKLTLINKAEKESFMKIMNYLMIENNENSTVEEYLALFQNYIGYTGFTIDKSNSSSITIETIKTIKTEWLMNLLIVLYILTQNKIESTRLNEVIMVLNKNELNNIKNLATLYKEVFENTIKLLQSDLIHKRNNKKTYEIIDYSIKLGLSTIPGIRYIKSGIDIGSNVVKINNLLDYGLVPIRSNERTDEIIICIDGFCSESKNQFEDWKTSFEILNTKSSVKGFKWDSGSIYEVLNWYEKLENTLKASKRLAQDILMILELSPNKNISLIGHSLGAKVIFHTLEELKENNIKLNNVYLMGGAISRENKQAWSSILSSVKNKLVNFYIDSDEILKKAFQITTFEKPIGLGEIEYYKYKDLEVCELININVSDIVKGHTDYKNKLPEFCKEYIN